MMYKNLKAAYLSEIIIGFITILLIAVIGEKGIFAVSLIAFRPLLFDRMESSPEILGLFYRLGKTSLIITFLTIIAYYLSAEYIFSTATDWKIILLLILPYFLVNHGIAGFIFMSNTKR